MKLPAIRPIGTLAAMLLAFGCWMACSNPPSAPGGEPLTGRRQVDTNPSLTPLSPQESMAKVQLPEGYHLQLVAAEPMVQEPVAISWDGDGRLYVAEMNTYMKDANATGEYEPTSRIMLLVDTNGDGRMDRATVFADSLLLPRAILAVGHELYVQETNRQHIWSFSDTNQDGKADLKRMVFRNDQIDPRNLEHQNGALYWNLDNWIYPSRDNLRYKWQKGKLIVDTVVDNMIGQWGLTSDDYGRLYYSEAGPGLPAVQIEQAPAYGALNFKDQYSATFSIPWPIVSTFDAQGGPDALRKEDHTLNKFTSGCGQSIFRGDRFPADMKGDYFIPEPVGRIIKRGRITNREGKITIDDVYHQKDWLASADMNFRPINTYTGPDGCFYIVDMYHGIIQESEWTKPDSYLGKIIAQKEIFKNRGMGRIYRVVHDSLTPDPRKPDLLEAGIPKLVSYLDHPNGWWRDHAQMELILRQDKAAVPILQKIVFGKKGPLDHVPGTLARIHALWTLEGLGALDLPTIKAGLQAKEPELRKTAIWASESLARTKAEPLLNALQKLVSDPSPDVRIQLMLSLRTVGNPQAHRIVQELLAQNPDNEMMQFSYATFKQTDSLRKAERLQTLSLSPADRELVTRGAIIFKQLCASCHGPDGRGILLGSQPMPAPPLAGSPRVKGDKTLLIQLLLNGLNGPVDGKTYPDIMASMGKNDDQWLACVLSYIRNGQELGNHASVVTEKEVREVRASTPKIPGGMSLQLLEIFKLGREERSHWKSEPADTAGKK